MHLTTIMYHYVRPIRDSKYPNIKGLELCDFIGQLNYIERNYNPISIEDLIDYKVFNKTLPSKPLLLTFDDGYIDHYEFVFPELKKRGLSGAFYPPEVGYFKRILQFGLDDEHRTIILNDLFKSFVTDDEKVFASKLYLGENQLNEMYEQGMHFGGHGSTHKWLDKLNNKTKLYEIQKSIQFLKKFHRKHEVLSFTYPYGGYDQECLDILEKIKCHFAFTTNIDLFEFNEKSRKESWLEISRLDTNHVPVRNETKADKWLSIINC